MKKEIATRFRVVLLMIAGACASGSHLTLARASCAAPAPKVAWSYPADGATNVPTNAAIWLLLENWQQPADITVNGTRVTVAEMPFLYRPGPLQPRTQYEITATTTSATQTLVDLKWHFVTGDAPSLDLPPSPPVIDEISTAKVRDLDKLCTAVWRNCYDTGQDTHLLFHPTGPNPLVWIVERIPAEPEKGEGSILRLWPGVCGTPEVYVTAAETTGCFRPYRLHAGDSVGAIAVSQAVCPSAGRTLSTDASVKDGSADATDGSARAPVRATGCAIAGQQARGYETSFWLAAALLIAVLGGGIRRPSGDVHRSSSVNGS